MKIMKKYTKQWNNSQKPQVKTSTIPQQHHVTEKNKLQLSWCENSSEINQFFHYRLLKITRDISFLNFLCNMQKPKWENSSRARWRKKSQSREHNNNHIKLNCIMSEHYFHILCQRNLREMSFDSGNKSFLYWRGEILTTRGSIVWLAWKMKVIGKICD